VVNLSSLMEYNGFVFHYLKQRTRIIWWCDIMDRL